MEEKDKQMQNMSTCYFGYTKKGQCLGVYYVYKSLDMWLMNWHTKLGTMVFRPIF